MSYSRGVLIHNFNEDHFGLDIKHSTPRIEPPAISHSHVSFCAKKSYVDKDAQSSATAASCVDRHVLFGHSGDMRNPHVTLQKRGFVTANHYFLKDPATLTATSLALSAEGFAGNYEPPAVTLDVDAAVSAVTEPKEIYNSPLAAKIRGNWGDRRQSMGMPPNEQFMTEAGKSFCKPPVEALRFDRAPRMYGEFSKGADLGMAGGNNHRGIQKMAAATPRGASIKATGKMVAR